MTYVFDTGPLIVFFNYYYEDRFPSLWSQFESLISDNRIISVSEVKRELKDAGGNVPEWIKHHPDFFSSPDDVELRFVKEIFQIQHYQTLINNKARLNGKPVADPFVIAKAKIIKGCVVSEERYKEKGAKIPNVCEHFKIPCINLEEFMKKENWSF